jgi:iron complex transport system substrate-binding protein
MNIEFKKLIVCTLLISLMTVGFCIASETNDTDAGSLRTIVDNAGNKVENLPAIEDINRVILISPPMLGMYYTLGFDMDKIIGTNPNALENAEMGVFYEMCPECSNITSDFFTTGFDVNAEELLKRNPDIALCDFDGHGKAFRAVEKFPVVTILDGKDTRDPFKTAEDMITMMNTVFGNQKKGARLIEYGEKALADVREKTATIDDENKLKAMVIHMTSDGKIDPRHKNFYSDFWLTESGLINVAGDLEVNSYVDMEQVYDWNPDIIFIYYGPSSKDIIENNVEGVDWSSIQAVKDKKVYTFPRGVSSWYPFGGESSLLIKWIAQTAYPDVFNYDMKQETFDFYKEFFDYELSDDQISKILTPDN